MTFLSVFSGFIIGFVCWKGCFVFARAIAAALFDVESLAPAGVKIAYGGVFLFLCGTTALLLLIYPIYSFIVAGASAGEFYLNAAPYVGSVFGFL